MFDLILTCIGYALLAAFWVSIFFASREGLRAGLTRRYARCGAFAALVAAVLWAGLFVGFTPGSEAYASYRFSRELFGRGFVLGSPRHSYDSPRAFNGDGYSIEVFETPDGLARLAAFPPAEFCSAFPIRPPFRSHWSGVPWHSTPITGKERMFLEFALMARADSVELTAAQRLLERLANEPGHYIAYFYYMHGDHVGNVDFFLISPSARVLIVVNHNT